MLRRVLTLFALGVLAFGMNAAAAQSNPATQASVRPPIVTAPAGTGPLAPGAAAGIRQAQGAQRNRIWNYVPFAVVGGLALLIVLGTGDDDETTTTTGTN